MQIFLAIIVLGIPFALIFVPNKANKRDNRANSVRQINVKWIIIAIAFAMIAYSISRGVQ